VRQEEDEEREKHRRAFDDMVERARQNPPQPHDPMRFRAVPPGVMLCAAMNQAVSGCRCRQGHTAVTDLISSSRKSS
jgi:hypothetical protein